MDTHARAPMREDASPDGAGLAEPLRACATDDPDDADDADDADDEALSRTEAVAARVGAWAAEVAARLGVCARPFFLSDGRLPTYDGATRAIVPEA